MIPSINTSAFIYNFHLRGYKRDSYQYMIYTLENLKREKKPNKVFKRKKLPSETELEEQVKRGRALGGHAWEFFLWSHLPTCLTGRQRPLVSAEPLEAAVLQLWEGWEGSLLLLPPRGYGGTFPQVL